MRSINISFPLAYSMGGKKILKIIKINMSDELNYYLNWSQLIEDVLFLSTAADLISPTLAAVSVGMFGRSLHASVSTVRLYLAAWKLSMCMMMHARGCKALYCSLCNVFTNDALFAVHATSNVYYSVYTITTCKTVYSSSQCCI